MKKNKYLKYYIMFGAIYFTQGIWALPSQAVFYWLKDTLGFGVDKIAYLSSIITLPWIIKPLYGVITDAFPIFGYRRKSYLIINYTIILLLSLWIFFMGLSVVSMVVIGFFCAICFAFNDVAVDGVMVETGQKYKLTGKFQSVQWGAINVATILTGVTGGLIAKHLSFQHAYGIVALFILGVLVYITKYHKEEKRKGKINHEAFKGIKSAIKNKQLWVALAFLFCLWFSPSFGTALMFKMRDILNFDKVFIGLLSTASSGFGILGAIVYYKICKKVDIKKLLYITTLSSAVMTFCYLYYPNWGIALTYSILFGTFGMITHLVIMDYAARISPKEAEAFTFAAICSMLNLGSMCSRLIGGFLYPKVGLNMLIIISGVFTLICLGFIPHLKLRRDNG